MSEARPAAPPMPRPAGVPRPRWRRLALWSAFGGAIGALHAYLAVAPPIMAYYAVSALQLCGAIAGIVLIASLLVYAALRTVERLGRHRLWRSLALYLGWHLLKNQQPVEPLRARLRRTWQQWLRPASLGRGALLQLLALLAGAALVLAFVDRRPSPWAPGTTALTGFLLGVGAALVLATASSLLGNLVGAGRRALGAPVATGAEQGRRLVQRNMVTTPTFIAIIGVAVGTWALLVVLSVMSGFENDLRQKILRTQDHVQIQHVPEKDQELGEIPEHLALAERLEALDGVDGAFPYVHGEVMLSSPTNISTSVSVKGIAPDDLRRSGQMRTALERGGPDFLEHPERLVSDTPYGERLQNGAGLEDLRTRLQNDGAARGDLLEFAPSPRIFPGLMIGRELARSLNVAVGSELQVISPEGGLGPMGVMPRSRSFRVAGVFNTGMYEYDMRLVYMTLSEAQRFFDLGDAVNRIELRVADTRRTDAVLERLAPILGPMQLEALDWKALNRSLFSALQLEKMVMFIVLGFIILVASFAIVASLVMIVMEKSREIAILKSMGATNGAVRNTFMTIGLVVGAVGTTAGVLLGVLTCVIIDRAGLQLPKAYYIESLPVVLDPLEVLAVGASALAISVAATLYPSMTASRLRPVEGLRYE